MQQSQYGMPVYIIPGKEYTLRSITDNCNLNKELVRNLYTLPIIGDTMQQLIFSVCYRIISRYGMLYYKDFPTS